MANHKIITYYTYTYISSGHSPFLTVSLNFENYFPLAKTSYTVTVIFILLSVILLYMLFNNVDYYN